MTAQKPMSDKTKALEALGWMYWQIRGVKEVGTSDELQVYYKLLYAALTSPCGEVTKEEIVSAAMQAGFMLSTRYGQRTDQPMPVTDYNTLDTFAKLLFSTRG